MSHPTGPLPDDDPRVRFARIREEIDRLDLPPDAAETQDPELDLGTETEAPPEPGEAELEAMDARIREAANVRMPDLPATPEIRRPVDPAKTSSGGFISSPEDARGLGIGLTVAYAFIGLTGVGLGLGFLVRNFTGFEGAVGLGAVLGFGLGLVAVITLLNRNKS